MIEFSDWVMQLLRRFCILRAIAQASYKIGNDPAGDAIPVDFEPVTASRYHSQSNIIWNPGQDIAACRRIPKIEDEVRYDVAAFDDGKRIFPCWR